MQKAIDIELCAYDLTHYVFHLALKHQEVTFYDV